nr:uncharacterized protein LOC111512339 [Leptinotarsa decemlineata]
MVEESLQNFSNASEADVDPFEDIEGWPTDDNIARALENYFTFHFISSIILNLIIVVVICPLHIFILYNFFRHKKLRSRLNLYILNCSIIDLSKQLLRIITYLIRNVGNSNTLDWLCFNTIMEYILFCLYISFGLGLAIDWFTSCYKPYLTDNLDKYFKFVIAVIYVIAFIIVIVDSSGCTIHSFWAMLRNFNFIVGFFITISVTLLVVNILAGKFALKNTNSKTSYALTIANISIYSFFPFFLYHIIETYSFNHILLDIFLLYTSVLPESIGCFHFLLILYIFWKGSKEFKVACSLCFKRSTNVYREDERSEDSDIGNNDIENTYVHADNYNSNLDHEALIL